MVLADLAALGDYAEAGLRAVQLALAQAEESGLSGRIPIAGAAVLRAVDGSLHTVTVGCNGRIPADGGAGYPTDHGETGALRHIHDVEAVDWSRVVFATTLSPCIMCTRSRRRSSTGEGSNTGSGPAAGTSPMSAAQSQG